MIGSFYDVYNELGFGYRELVYSLALERDLVATGHRIDREVAVMVYFRGGGVNMPEPSPFLEQGPNPCYSKDVAKVTSKLQVTIPKRVADEFAIAPGDEIEFIVAGGSIRVIKSGARTEQQTPAERLALFDRATARQKARQRTTPRRAESGGRGWTRDGLYDRGRTR